MSKKPAPADLPEAPRTSEEWEVVVTRLEAERVALVEREAAAAAESRPLALDAALGKSDAVTRLGEVNVLRTALARDVDNARIALEDARDRLEAARGAEAEASRADRERQARELAGQIIEVDREVDALFGQLRAVFERRKALTLALRPVGHLDVTRHKRLQSPSMVLGAMQAAKLQDYLPLTRTAPAHWLPLATWDARVLAPLLPPAEGAPPAEAPEIEEAAA